MADQSVTRLRADNSVCSFTCIDGDQDQLSRREFATVDRGQVDRIVAAVDNVLKPVGGRVNSIVNYDAFWVDPDVAEYYLDAVRYVESTYYLKVSRYTTNGFMRIKLSQGLEERDISSDVVQTFVEAKESLDSD